jgi:parvulin-like peptidyl-prolyl isomerase
VGHYPLLIILTISGLCSYTSFQLSSTTDPVVDSERSSPLSSKTGVETSAPFSFIIFSEPSPADEISQNQAFENGRALAARVNGQPIYLDVYEKQAAQLERALQPHDPGLSSDSEQAGLQQIRQRALEGLLDQLIIEQQAPHLNISINEAEVEAKAEAAVAQIGDQAKFQQWLVANDLTYQTFIANLRSQLIAGQVFEQVTQQVPHTAEQIQLRYIHTADQAVAQKLATELENGRDFSLIAQTQTPDEKREISIGDLGWLPRKTGLIPAEVETVAFALQPGEISGPIQTVEGFYIVKLEHKEAARPLTDNLLHILKKQIFLEWLQEKRAAATIERYVTL